MGQALKKADSIEQPADTIGAELLENIRLCGRLFGISICFHDYTNELLSLIGRDYFHHENDFCTFVRKDYLEQCMRCDMQLVHERFAEESSNFVKMCHAGVSEVVIPVHRRDARVAAVFMGPFVWEDSSELPPNSVVQSTLKKRLEAFGPMRAELPKVSQRKLDDIIGIGRMLAFQIGTCLEQAFTGDSSMRGGYKERINAIIHTRMAQQLTLPQLSETLFLSPSRTSKLIRRHFNKTFPELLTDIRLQQAKHYLQNTSLKIALIVEYTGFKDKSYFHRIFKRKTGMTPRAFRLKESAGEQSRLV